MAWHSPASRAFDSNRSCDCWSRTERSDGRARRLTLWCTGEGNRLQSERLQAGRMLRGLYKVEMHTVHGSRRGVLYAYDGKIMGGNSAFAFIGTYQESDAG